MYKLSRLSLLQVVFCTKTKTQINSFYENFSLNIGYMCISLKRLLRYRTISYVWFCSSGTNCVNCKWHAIIFFMLYSLHIWIIYSLKVRNVFALALGIKWGIEHYNYLFRYTVFIVSHVIRKILKLNNRNFHNPPYHCLEEKTNELITQ